MVETEEENRSRRDLGLPSRLLLLVVALGLVGVVSIPVACQFGFVDLWMAMLAFLVCGISSLVAHVAGEYPSGDDNFAARLALSMAVRTGPPFLLVIFLKMNSALPDGPGFVVLIVLFYMVGLVVDVSLQSMRLNQPV